MKKSYSIVGLVLLASIGYVQAAMAQVSADGTVGTIVSPGPVFNITGGTRPTNGPNLFHSFSQFSLPTGNSAIFQNDPTVQTIFSRVTGGSRSEIDGMIQTQGNASLFLMNPNGIVFGPNAKLELGGSFVGTTANSIKFEDGIEFSAANLTANPLLTVKVPIGLQMGINPRSIQVQGAGHKLTINSRLTAGAGNSLTGLRVKPGNTLALVGGNVSLIGGILTTPAGHIEIGSVGSGSVGLQAMPQGWHFTYDQSQTFQNIGLSKAALLDSTGNGGGSIHLQGGQVTLQSSYVLSQNTGTQAPGTIQVDATEFLDLSPAADSNVRPYIWSDTKSTGSGAGIIVKAPQVRVSGSGSIGTTSSTGSRAGNITIQATDSVRLEGKRELALIHSYAYNTSQSGDIFVSAPAVRLFDGGLISAATFGSGKTGNVDVNAAKTIEVSGVFPNGFVQSAIAAVSFATGKTGNTTINTGHLKIANGGQVGTFALAGGSAGDTRINALESVEVSGQFRVPGNTLTPRTSKISAAVLLPTEADNQVRSLLPSKPSGTSGNLSIHTPILKVLDGATVTVENYGTGTAGNIEIQANSLILDHQGKINSATGSGEGGNINLQVKDLLLLRHSSFMSAQAGGLGKGGNIIINAPVIVGLENSDIIANATGGRGGNINITTQDVIGLKFRNTRTPRTDLTNDITASSEFSLNGNVSINTIGINPTNALNALPIDIVDASRQISDRCASAKTGSFVSTGRGGIPKNPMQTHNSDRPWNDLRDIGNDRSPLTTVTTPIIQNPTAIVEASALQTHFDGSIELVTPTASAIASGATCALQ